MKSASSSERLSRRHGHLPRWRRLTEKEKEALALEREMYDIAKKRYEDRGKEDETLGESSRAALVKGLTSAFSLLNGSNAS